MVHRGGHFSILRQVEGKESRLSQAFHGNPLVKVSVQPAQGGKVTWQPRCEKLSVRPYGSHLEASKHTYRCFIHESDSLEKANTVIDSRIRVYMHCEERISCRKRFEH